jgi:hypothetical protein
MPMIGTTKKKRSKTNDQLSRREGADDAGGAGDTVALLREIKDDLHAIRLHMDKNAAQKAET